MSDNKSLCDTCSHMFTCERSDVGISYANHSVCYEYDPVKKRKVKKMNNDLISRDYLKSLAYTIADEYCGEKQVVDLSDINNAPTVEPFEPDYVGAERLKARQRGYEDGYHTGMAIGKTLNPKIKQGEWILNKDENPECPFCHSSFTYWGNFCSNCGADMR